MEMSKIRQLVKDQTLLYMDQISKEKQAEYEQYVDQTNAPV